MVTPRAIIFDLGGTLVECWDAEHASQRQAWASSYDYLVGNLLDSRWPDQDTYVQAMLAAEQAYWQRVVDEQWSGPPSCLLSDGFRRLGLRAHDAMLTAALDGYARAVHGWTVIFPDARDTLKALRDAAYRLGLLSNTWWPAQWHNTDLATHGLRELLDDALYTSELSHAKPHPSVFREAARRLGVRPADCLVVGDRMIEDVFGSLEAGMQAVWKENNYPWPRPEEIVPTASISQLAELPPLLRSWGESD